MKIRTTTKMRIKAVLMIMALLLPILTVPASSTLGMPGSLANFEMKINKEGSNILGTIIYLPGWIPSAYQPMDASTNFIVSPVNVYPANVTQYIDGGMTSALYDYEFSARSYDSNIVEATVETDEMGVGYLKLSSTDTDNPFGTAVIAVEMWRRGQNEDKITETFTVRIVDAAKHGSSEATFLKNGSAFSVSEEDSSVLNLDMRTNSSVTVTIGGLIGHDYSDLSSNINYKNISGYTWNASVTNSIESNIRINDADVIATQTINAGVAVEGSTSDIIVTSEGEGSGIITVNISPGGSEAAYFSAVTYKINVNVQKALDDFSFEITADKNAYLSESAYDAMINELQPFNSYTGVSIKSKDEGLLVSQMSFTSGSTFEPDMKSDVDIMFQKPTEPMTEPPTEVSYDMNSDVDIMFQNKNNTNNNTSNSNGNTNSNNNNSNNTNNSNSNSNNTNNDNNSNISGNGNSANSNNTKFEPDMNSDVDIMFQRPTEPVTEPPTEVFYDMNSDVDIMFQNKNNTNNNTSNNNSNTNSNNNNSNNTNTNTNNNNNNNTKFEPDMNSDVDIMFQRPTEPVTEPPTEVSYDMNSDVDIMFQNKNNANNTNNNSNTNSSNNNTINNNSNTNTNSNLYGDANGISGAGLNSNPNSNSNNSSYASPANSANPENSDNSTVLPSEIRIPRGDTRVNLNVNNFKAKVNGAWQDISNYSYSGSNIPANQFQILNYSYSYPKDRTNAAPNAEERISISGNNAVKSATDGEILLADSEKEINILIDGIVKQENFPVTVTVEAEIYGVKVISKVTYNVIFVDIPQEKSVRDIFITGLRVNQQADGGLESEISEGQTISAKVNKDNEGEPIRVEISQIQVFDISELQGTVTELQSYMDNGNYIKVINLNSPTAAEQLNRYGYTFAISSSNNNAVAVETDTVGELTSNLNFISANTVPRFVLMPQKPSSSINIAISVISQGISEAAKRVFNVSVSNIGIFNDKEGNLNSVTLKSSQGTIYDRSQFYMKDGAELEIDISKVMEFSAEAKASDNFVRELKTYKWKAESSNPDIVTIVNPFEEGVIAEDGYIHVTDKSSADKKSFIVETRKNMFSGNEPVIITLTVESTREGEGVSTGSFITISFGIKVNALGGEFLPVIQYDTETIKIAVDMSEDSAGMNYTYYDFGSDYNGEFFSPEYMYCLKAASDGASQANEKWYPFMGNEMDISTLIPKNGTTPYRLGIRRVDAVLREDGSYSPTDRRVVLIYPRKALSSADKKAIVYKNGMIMLNSPGADPVNISYKVDLSDWLDATISGESGIAFPSEVAPTGSVVQVKYSYTIDYENGRSEFNSDVIKVKIPKAAKKPNIKLNAGKGTYSGFTAKMEYTTVDPFLTTVSATQTGSESSESMWKDCSKGAVSYNGLYDKFQGLNEAPVDEDGNVTIYIRTKAVFKNGTLKTPSSEIVALKVPANTVR